MHTTQPQVGSSVVLNIDTGLQKALDGYLSSNILKVRSTIDPTTGKRPPALNGTAIVMNPNNGQVLAMSSYPSFNLDSFITGLSTTQYKDLIDAGAFNNYAIQGVYTPGSTFKMVTATAMMKTGIFSPNAYVNDTGAFTVPGCLQGAHGCVFHDDEKTGAGRINLAGALAASSDYYFYNLGYLFWSQQSKYGQTPIQEVATQYGLDNYTNIDLPNESSGRVDSPSVRVALHNANPKAFPNSSWYTGDNVEMAFGQGTTAVTPMELANAYATFANGGTRYAPEVAAGIINAHGKVVQRYLPRVQARMNLPASIRNPILQGLVGVVNSSHGTANGTFKSIATFNMNNFVIAGKTGTASNAPGLSPNSWFVGFGPVPNPKYVVVCVVAEGGYGAEAAAPVVAQAFNYLVAHPIKPVTLKLNVAAVIHASSTTTTIAKSTTSTVSPKKPG